VSAYTITSNEDDSVTLTCGTVRAHITGASWDEANRAASLLANALITQRATLRGLERLRRLQRYLQHVSAQITDLDALIRADGEEP
jgi:hypothetical protein